MKKTKKTALTAAVLSAAVSLSACNWFGSEYQVVYGPPPEEYEEEATEEATEPTEQFEPSEQEIQFVYGPPEDISQ